MTNRLNDRFIKKIVHVIFVVRGICGVFSSIHIENATNKPNVYIKHYIVTCKHKKYIVALGINWLQKKKLKNAVLHEKQISGAYKDYFKFNNALKTGRFLFVSYAIYNYFDNVVPFANDEDFEYALNAAKNVYETAYWYDITEKNVDDFIIKNILIIVPFISREKIINQPAFQECKSELLKIGKIKCAPQHGDYNLPNMLKKDNDFYLVDLERSMPNMIASYDWYHLLKGQKNGWFNPIDSSEMKQVPYANILKLFINIFIGKEPGKL